MGEKYEGTRHNIGFDVVDLVASKRGVAFSSEKFGHVASFQLGGERIFLLKPNTFMNLSGDAVSFWLRKAEVPMEKLLVITDDLALPFGKIRLKQKGSSGGHNGLSHIEATLKTQAYARLRMGIGSDFPKGRQSDYVLGQFPADSLEEKNRWIDRAAEAVLCFCTRGLNVAMNQFNS